MPIYTGVSTVDTRDFVAQQGIVVNTWHTAYSDGYHAAAKGNPSPANAGTVDTSTDTAEAGYHAGFRDQCILAGLAEDETLHACDTCARPLARPGEDLCDYCGHFGEGAHEAEAALAGLARVSTPDSLSSAALCVRCGQPAFSPQSRYCAEHGRANWQAYKRGEW